MEKIAVLLTCFNRKSKTRNCLQSLLSILPDANVFLVDDASTDGTVEMIKSEFPMINLIRGDGNLFWSRGMYLAWSHAIKGDYDYYLWLNDDVLLYPYFYQELKECMSLNDDYAIISGLIEDMHTHKTIYGGTNDFGVLIAADGKMHCIHDMNGNVVLISRAVIQKIGIIDPVYHHGGADTDYGYTARKHGIPVLSTRCHVAAGYENNFCRIRKWNTSIIKRFKVLYSPMGLEPNIGFYMMKKHFGICKAIFYWTYIHILNILPDRIITFIWGDKYIDKSREY